MKKYFLSFLALSLVTAGLFFAFSTLAQSRKARPSDEVVDIAPASVIAVDTADVVTVSPSLVISQFQAGGTTNANDEFIEIHNNGAAAVDLNGYRIVYRSQNGTSDVNFYVWTTTNVIQPGQYFLVTSLLYTGSVPANATYDNTACSCAMAAAQGGLAIRQGSADTGLILDAVGWGTTTNIFFEGTRTTAPGNSNSKIRLQGGCTDTDNNSTDFATQIPSAPRNATTTPVACSGGGSTLFAGMSASPSTVAVPGDTLLTVTVAPATSPASTGITVTGNLSAIGGAASQTFYDDGTHGDDVAGDNVFTVTTTIPATISGGNHTVTALAADAEGRTVNLNQIINVTVPSEADNPILFGNPSGATADVTNFDNYLMVKPQYTISYNRTNERPNWSAWRLDSSWLGSSGRSNAFAPDTTLPNGWYEVTPDDYSEPVYDRGHMCPSGDRTNTVVNNIATFLMTNMVAQRPENNQGPWADFENYCRTLAGQGKEIYIISGPHGNLGVIGNGVVIPDSTWKVVLILPNGSNDLKRTQNKGVALAFGIIIPNTAGTVNISNKWPMYRVTVRAVEALTGYNFNSNLSVALQDRLETK